MPALATARRRLWAWQGRTRFSERHPVVSAIASFVVVAVVATVLVVGTLYLFHKIRQHEI